MFIKYEFWNSIFENYKIENCNFTWAGFHNGNFKDYNFIKVNLSNLRGSDFFNFEFIETKFKNSNFDLIGVTSIKISNSKHSVEIENSSNLEKILKDMNLIISTDQDEMENY